MPSLYPNNVGGDVQSIIGLRPVDQVAAAGFSLKGTGLDCMGRSSFVAHVAVGALTGGGTFTVDGKLQHSDTDVDGNYADCTTNPQNPSVAIVQATAVNTDKRLEIDCTGLKRFVRMVFTVTFSAGTKIGLMQTFIVGGQVLGNPTQ